MQISWKINALIFLLLLISFWIVISVEFNILMIDTNLSIDECVSINNIFQNLSYSFIGGSIMYVLTIFIPGYFRGKIYSSMVSSIISEYYGGTLYSYFMYCANSDSLIPDSKDDEFIQNYSVFMKKVFKIDIYNLIPRPHPYTNRLAYIKPISDVNKTFIQSIIPYQIYLSTKQLNLLKKIREGQISIKIDSSNYKDAIDEDSKTTNSIYNTMKEHIKMVDSLFNTLD